MIVFLAYIFVIYIALYYVTIFFKRRNAPPGPIPIPILGNVIQISQADPKQHLALGKLAKVYGDVYSLKLGQHDYVVLSSMEAFSEIFAKEESAGRPLHGVIADRNGDPNFGVGIGFCEGEFWQKKRMWTVKNLREYGFSKTTSMEARTIMEVQTLMDKLEAKLGNKKQEVVHVTHMFLMPLFKIMWSMLVGEYTQEDDKIMDEMLHKSLAHTEKGSFGPGLILILPFIKYLFPNWTGYKVQMEFYEHGRRVANNLLKREASKLRSTGATEPDNWVQAYVLQMEKDPKNFFEHDFEILFLDLAQGSSDTTGSYLETFFLYMLHYPDVQEKVFQELQENIPPGQEASFSDYKKMIYTQAVVLEVHRFGIVLPHYIPRGALKDIRYKNYVIKKGTAIMPDVWSVNNSKKFGPDHETFNPERFLDKEGKCLNRLYKEFAPFSLGKRNCMGEQLSQLETFLFVSSILRKYKISNPPGKPLPSLDLNMGITTKPFPYDVLVTLRAP